MAITSDDIQKSLRIKRTINAYFERTNNTKVEAKDLMADFFANGIFTSNNKTGLPIRNFLKKLDEENHLHLIPHVQVEQVNKTKNWFFVKRETPAKVSE